MKYFIVGLHASGKQEIVSELEKLGVKCGKNFTNCDFLTDEIYNSKNYEQYSIMDINNVFENDAYIFMHELPDAGKMNFTAHRWYEGLSKYAFDQNDVFILSPDQLLEITPKAINEEVCFVWLDNNKANRSNRYHNEKRLYNFNTRDEIERKDLGSFIKSIYSFNNSHILYFTNEEPVRVATIIYTLIKHPDMFELYTETFNN